MCRVRRNLLNVAVLGRICVGMEEISHTLLACQKQFAEMTVFTDTTCLHILARSHTNVI